MPESHPDRAWESATYAGARRAQIRDWTRMTPAARLDWLDQAQNLATFVRESRRRRGLLTLSPRDLDRR